MLEVIYVTRHGFRSNWLVDPSNGNYTNYLKSPTGGAADPALTAHGVDQANELASRLLAVEPPIERVYSSLYYRCLQTIEPFIRKVQRTASARTGGEPGRLGVRGETGLGEWYGSADFEHPVPASLEKLKELFPGLLDPDYRPAVTPNRQGESIEELHDRVAAVIEAIIAECDRDGVRSILLCTHAAVIIALGRVLTGNMPDDFEVDDFKCFTCGLSAYRRRRRQGLGARNEDAGPVMKSTAERDTNSRGEDGTRAGWKGGRGVSGGWDCELNSDCSHLSLGEERGWSFHGDESFKDTVTTQGMLDTARRTTATSNDENRAHRAQTDSRRGKL
ncbi:hypothetical protein VTH82DRAFT_844 [Thermothelomyces myriococcoides]